MSDIRRFVLTLVALAAIFGFGQPRPGAADDSPQASESVPEQSQIRFEQDRAEAHMRELEMRMFRLAELLKATEPDDASRLRLGVEKAREELIAERMKGAGAMLEELRLAEASGEQEAIIEKLEELRRLLLSIDIDLELKLEQLKRLREAQRLLESLIDRESDQKDQTAKAEKSGEARKAETAKALSETEDRNKRLSDDLIAKLARFGNRAAGASGQIGKAGSSMKKASSDLMKKNAGEAQKKQADALKKLEDAQLALKQLEQAMNEELEKFVLRRVMETLEEMIAHQQQVREETERLQPRVAAVQESAIAAVRELEPKESELLERCDYVVELSELVQLSLMLPAAMESIGSQVEAVADDLAAGRASEQVVEAERQIEDDLAAVLDALKEATRPGGKGGGQCQGCKGNRNKLLAEVKMLRWMQGSLLRRSERLVGRTGELSETELQDRADPLSQQQRDIQRLTLKLHDGTCQDCLNGI